MLLIPLTVLNAVVGMRQEGKADSAMNALEVDDEDHRPGTPRRVEAQIPADQVVVGDIVLVTAGDQVPADGRIVAGQRAADRRVGVDRGERPGRKDADTLPAGEPQPRRPEQHGVHEHAGDARQRR